MLEPNDRFKVYWGAPIAYSYRSFLFQLAEHDRDMTLVTQILWGRTTHVSSVEEMGECWKGMHDVKENCGGGNRHFHSQIEME